MNGVLEAGWKQMKGTSRVFSEQHLVNCSKSDAGCRGGYPTRTAMFLRDNGVVLEKECPYQAKDMTCDTNKFKDKLYKIFTGLTYLSEARGMKARYTEELKRR